MNRNIILSLEAGVVLGAAALAGCAQTDPWFGPQVMTPNTVNQTTAGANYDSSPPPPASGLGTASNTGTIAFAGQAAGTPTERPARQPFTSLIGLYGELITESADAGGQFDGGGNISQVSFATEGTCFDPDIDRTGTLLPL